jgi:hypothetical protein
MMARKTATREKVVLQYIAKIAGNESEDFAAFAIGYIEESVRKSRAGQIALSASRLERLCEIRWVLMNNFRRHA